MGCILYHALSLSEKSIKLPKIELGSREIYFYSFWQILTKILLALIYFDELGIWTINEFLFNHLLNNLSAVLYLRIINEKYGKNWLNYCEGSWILSISVKHIKNLA